MTECLQWKQAHPFGLFDPLGCLGLSKSLSYFHPFFLFIHCWLCRVRSYLSSGTWDLSSLTRDQTCSPALEGLFFTTGSPTLYLSIYEGHFSCFHVFMATHTWTPYLHALNNNMHPNFRNAEVEKNYACRKTFHPVSVRKNLTIQSEYLRLRISASPPDNSVMSHTWRYSRDLMKHEAS